MARSCVPLSNRVIAVLERASLHGVPGCLESKFCDFFPL